MGQTCSLFLVIVIFVHDSKSVRGVQRLTLLTAWGQYAVKKCDRVQRVWSCLVSIQIFGDWQNNVKNKIVKERILCFLQKETFGRASSLRLFYHRYRAVLVNVFLHKLK